MKLSNYLMMGTAALLLASCSQEESVTAPVGELSTINFQLSTQQIKTKSFDDGSAISNLKYAVYEVTNGSYTRVVDMSQGVNFTGSTTIPMQLPNGSAYTIVFWASSASNPYTVSLNENGAVMTVNTTALKCNDVNTDAFYSTVDLGVISSDANVAVELKRPFAQLNVGTNDYAKVDDNHTPSQSTITVKGAPTSLDLIAGTVSGSEDLVFGWYDINKAGNDYPKKAEGYEYLAMAYVLVGENTTHDIVFSFKSTAAEVKREVGSVPVERNHRTNLFGSLLTSNQNIVVEVTPGFEDDWDEDLNGAKVRFDEKENKYICETPALPKGVTEEQIKDKGGVYVDAEGNTQIFSSDVKDIVQAFSQASEIYFAPNIEIPTDSHALIVPATGITVHGNGATLTKGEKDISIDSKSNKFDYTDIVNINLYNLNGVKLWGVATGGATFNINIKKCAITANGMNDGTHSFLNARGTDGKFNILFEDCYMEDGQLGIHHTYEGTTTVNRCTFNKVGIPINIAKKNANAPSEVIVTNCTFIECGIGDEYNNLDAYEYSAPVRVVDNGGPEENMNVVVDKCTFTNTQSKYDILLMDERPTKKWFPVKYEVNNCGEYKLKATDVEE